MSRLADYFVVVGYDHEKESKCFDLYFIYPYFHIVFSFQEAEVVVVLYYKDSLRKIGVIHHLSTG